MVDDVTFSDHSIILLVLDALLPLAMLSVKWLVAECGQASASELGTHHPRLTTMKLQHCLKATYHVLSLLFAEIRFTGHCIVTAQFPK